MRSCRSRGLVDGTSLDTALDDQGELAEVMLPRLAAEAQVEQTTGSASTLTAPRPQRMYTAASNRLASEAGYVPASASSSAATSRLDASESFDHRLGLDRERSALRERCRYGEQCYRRHSEHTAQYSHPGDEDWEASTARQRAVSNPSQEAMTEGSQPPAPQAAARPARSPGVEREIRRREEARAQRQTRGETEQVEAPLNQAVEQIMRRRLQREMLAAAQAARDQANEAANSSLQSAILMSLLPHEKWNVQYIRDEDNGDGDAECKVCLVEYEPGQEIVRLPCMHYAHTQCMEAWLVRDPRCPFCRLSVRDHVGLEFDES